MDRFFFKLKVFFSVIESEFSALHLQHLSQLRRSAEENGDFALLLSRNLLEDFVPIRSASVRSRL